MTKSDKENEKANILAIFKLARKTKDTPLLLNILDKAINSQGFGAKSFNATVGMEVTALKVWAETENYTNIKTFSSLYTEDRFAKILTSTIKAIVLSTTQPREKHKSMRTLKHVKSFTKAVNIAMETMVHLENAEGIEFLDCYLRGNLFER